MKNKRSGVPGTFEARIADEQPSYPFSADDGPAEFTVGFATCSEMTAAGFPRDDFELLTFVDTETGEEIPGGSITFQVLCDRDGKIVATWDRGRWWTPYESARLVQDIVAGRERP